MVGMTREHITDGPTGELSTARVRWAGRHDGDGPAHERWHQRVRIVEPGSGPGEGGELGEHGEHVALLGFASDEGVRRNGGRVGASEGPTALRAALGPLAVLQDRTPALVDYGDVTTIGTDLEAAATRMGAAVSRALGAPGNRLTVVLGGGHETAWPSYLGLTEHLDEVGAARPTWGVLNLDAHYDLREASVPTSGTPFLQMAEAERTAGRDLHYAVIGISEASNTTVLADKARDLGVQVLTDLECAAQGAEGITAFIERFTRPLDLLYLTIDLDVLPAHHAPGVSAPAAFGVDYALIIAAVRAAAASGKLRLLDVVELCPELDIDQRTAKAAARLVWEAVRTRIEASVGPSPSTETAPS